MNRLGGWSKPCEHTSQLPKKCKRESRGSFIIASGTTHERGAVTRSRNEISKTCRSPPNFSSVQLFKRRKNVYRIQSCHPKGIMLVICCTKHEGCKGSTQFISLEKKKRKVKAHSNGKH